MPDIQIGNILGGVAYNMPPTDLPQYFLADGKNVIPTLNGYGKKRGGSSNLNSTAYGTLITTFHEMTSGGTSYKFASQGTKIGLLSGTAFSDHITGLTSGLYGQWLNYGDYAIYVNGADKAKKTDGSTGSDLTSDLGSLTGARCICEFAERIWIGGYNGNIARLTACALRGPTDFSTTGDSGFWQGYVGDKNSGITGLTAFFDVLLIGKLNQIYQLTGAPETDSSTFRLTPLQTKQKDSFGFTSKTAITQVGNDLLFLDGFNVKALSGVGVYGDVESISIIGNIKDFFRDSAGAGLDKNYLSNAHFFHYKHREQIWCSIPTGASTRYWFIIDYSNRDLRAALKIPQYSFFPMAGLTPICFGGVEDGARVDVYMGCEDGIVRKMDTGIDDGSTAIDAHMTWALGHGERNIQPRYAQLNIKYDGTSCTFTPSYAMGYQDWEGIIDSSNYTDLDDEDVTESDWRSKGNVVYKKISSFMHNTDRTFALKLRHNTVGETFEMRKSSLGFRLKHRYVG